MGHSYDALLWTGRVEGLPPRFVGATLETVPAGAPAQMVALRYCEGRRALQQGLGMLHLGRTRAWKSYCTAAVAERAVRRNVGVQWVDVPADFARFTIDRHSAWAKRQLYVWTHVQMLVLDDFAVIEPGSFGHELLGAVISARFNRQLPTHVTGNLAVTPETVWLEVAARYGPMICRRLEDMSTGYRSISG